MGFVTSGASASGVTSRGVTAGAAGRDHDVDVGIGDPRREPRADQQLRVDDDRARDDAMTGRAERIDDVLARRIVRLGARVPKP